MIRMSQTAETARFSTIGGCQRRSSRVRECLSGEIYIYERSREANNLLYRFVGSMPFIRRYHDARGGIENPRARKTTML